MSKSQIPNPKKTQMAKSLKKLYANRPPRLASGEAGYTLSPSSGFTLIELVVVIGILSVLATFLLVVVNPVVQYQKASNAKRKSDLAQLQRSLEQYYQDNGKYPPNAVSCQYQIQGDNGDGNDCISWGQSWQPYMNVLPEEGDPLKRYVYFVTASGQSYYLYASLDNADKDAQACHVGTGVVCDSLATNSIPADSCSAPASSGKVCNYAVTSPNVTP